MKNLIILVVGPSGAGKSSFLRKATQERTDIKELVSCTTRAMRVGESQGDPYYFMAKEEFMDHCEKGYFVEWAQVHDSFYGSPKNGLRKAWDDGKVLITDVDTVGAKVYMNEYPEETKTIFIMPPSIEHLRERVLSRDPQSVADLDLRMHNAKAEMAQAGDFHKQVVNDKFETSYKEFSKIIDEWLQDRKNSIKA